MPPPKCSGSTASCLDEKGTDDPGFLSQWGYFLGKADRMKVLAERFHNLGEGRIRDMDATGIARQIVSLTSPGVQIFDAPTGTALATSFNDQLAEACRKYPDRFSGLAAIAPQNPAAAAKELQRGVTQLGLKGAIINSNTHGEYLDDPEILGHPGGGGSAGRADLSASGHRAPADDRPDDREGTGRRLLRLRGGDQRASAAHDHERGVRPLSQAAGHRRAMAARGCPSGFAASICSSATTRSTTVSRTCRN